MKTLQTISTGTALARELADLAPKGYGVATTPPRGPHPAEPAFAVFLDIDTADPQLIKTYSGRTFVIAVTGQERTGPVMEAAAWGAYEIMGRPLRKDRVERLLAELSGLAIELERRIEITKDELAPAATCAIVGRSALVMEMCEKIARIAPVEVPVLISGETGTGKELVAEAVSQLSSRFGKPFIVINSAAVPETLLESELFGYEKGAFTGASASKDGMLRAADGGSVFFDEVGELPPALQGKLLRFLQTQTFYPVGGLREVQVNVRVISATNRDLPAMVRDGKFREDLYHRLRVATIHVPPLRERKKDIPPLVQCLFYRHAHLAQKPIKGVTRAFLEGLQNYEWPGNIRELENTIRSAIALCKTDYLTTRELTDLGSHAVAAPSAGLPDALSAAVIPFARQLIDAGERGVYDRVHREVDRSLLRYALAHGRDNQSEAARLLGITRVTLRKKMGAQR